MKYREERFNLKFKMNCSSETKQNVWFRPFFLSFWGNSVAGPVCVSAGLSRRKLITLTETGSYWK